MLGSSSNGTSTPKSPRATIIPSLTFKISSRLLTPARLSIFAIISISPSGEPPSLSQLLISITSCAFETNEAATKSTPCSTPNFKSALSCSDRYSISSSLSGKNIDFLFESSPPTSVLQITFGFSTFTTSKTISPLFKSILSPANICSQMPLKETATRVLSPTMSSVVKVKVSPSFKVIFPFSKVFILNSGPLVSRMIGRGTFFCSLTFFIFAIFAACSSCVPCEKLSLATFMPASISSESIFSLSLAGPNVQMIFVFFIECSLSSVCW